MSQNCFHATSVQKVFEFISNYMKDAHDVLLEVLHEEPNFKRLRRTCQKQFFDAPKETNIDAESMKSRLCVAETNFLAVEVDKDIDKIVQEKFQGESLDKLKDEVLQAMLCFSSGEVNISDVTCQASTFPKKSKKDKENTALAQITNLNNNGIQNGHKQESNVTDKQTKPLLASKLDLDDCDADLSIISFDSVSSVHTSDLSSFEDEISLSSEEEFGEKKRLSLREVQEKLEVSKSEIMNCTDNEQKNNIKSEDAQPSSPENTTESSSMSQKSHRKRKPNFKYTDEDMTLPLKKRSNKKPFRSSQSVCGDIPRKRGRPRKYST